jgi:PAS domain S-box-containing protein
MAFPDAKLATVAALPQRLRLEPELHAVQFYSKDETLLDDAGRAVGEALAAAGGAIVIAADSHREELTERLKQHIDLSAAIEQGRYVALDAADTLSRIEIGGFPAWPRFAQVVGAQVARVHHAAGDHLPAAIFAEMGSLCLDAGSSDAALQLEQFWNSLAKTHSFSLHCAYRINSFSRPRDGELFQKICAEHSAIIPSESYTLLPSEDQRIRRIAYLQQRAQALEAEAALRRAEERFRLFIEAVQDYAIFMLDPEGHVATWNLGAERIKGYKASEIVGKHFSCFYPEEDARAGKPRSILNTAAAEGRCEDEGWRVRKDGSKFWANVVLTALRDREGNLVGFCKVTRDFTERLAAQKSIEESRRKLQESERSLRELSLHLLHRQEEERRRIGRELHDSLGQYLALMRLKLDAMQAEGSETVQNLAAECAGIVEDCVKEVRTLSHLLYPPMLEEMGLARAVSWYTEGFTERSGIQTSLWIAPNLGRFPPYVEAAIFRVLQESLMNVHKHSGAEAAFVRLTRRNGHVILEVNDRGKGIPPSILEGRGPDWQSLHGVGLRGMNERMRQLGGSLELVSTPNGATVIASVPVGPPSSSVS